MVGDTGAPGSFEIDGAVELDTTDSLEIVTGSLLITQALTQYGGDVSLDADTSLTVSNAYTVSAGTIEDCGTITAPNGLALPSGVTFSGSGYVIANVSNAGTFVTGAANGSSSGTISITGSYTQTGGSTGVNGELDVSGTFEQDGGTALISEDSVFNVGAFLQTGGDIQMYFTNACYITNGYSMTGGTAEFFYSGGTLGGGMALNGGTLQINSATTLTVSGGINIGTGGILQFFGGTIAADVTNAGTLSLDEVLGPDAFYITGNYTQLSSGTLIMAGTDYSYYNHLSISGTATFAGTFVLDLGGSYDGYPGDSFNLISYGSCSGAFATLSLPSLTNPYASGWQADYGDSTYPNAFSLWVV